MSNDEQITIRVSTVADVAALARLAALDSTDVPRGRALIAEVNGSMRAAFPLDGGRAIADPFAESAHVLELLEVHARALTPAASQRKRIRKRATRVGDSLPAESVPVTSSL